MATKVESHLVLGWEVTPQYDPRYWVDSEDARPGQQNDADLFRVPAPSIAAHTAVIAQSGSGKSFFVGRLIEEIALRTRARCLILDPNADFRKIREIEDATLWTGAKYKERRGKLPHEASREVFAKDWREVSVRVRTGSDAWESKPGAASERLQIWWPSLSMAFLAEDIDPMLRSELYHCHALVQELGVLVEIRYWAAKEEVKLIDEARRIFRLARGLGVQDLRTAMEQDYDVAKLAGIRNTRDADDFLYFIDQDEIKKLVTRFVDRVATISDYVSANVERFYFGRTQEYAAAGILQEHPRPTPWTRTETYRLDVVDLPSIRDAGTKLLAISAVLATEWERARAEWNRELHRAANEDNRVPTFVIVDEAHNLIPEKPRGKPEESLREQFRTIAAEGRKYGLFLLLVSQRPDKLDRMVLSECENKAVMKLGSGSVLALTREMLGLDDLPQKLLEKCLEFETGRVLMVGSWAPNGPEVTYAAARRTLEGGRNLQPDKWAKPPDDFGPQVVAPSTQSGSVRKRTPRKTSKRPAKRK
jgi:hypothetical protein